ncbi:MAG: hypothetical protein ACYDH5_06115 [Acidimicrobiales bacterium]
MAQLVTRLDDRLVGEIDQGVVATRSEAVRLGLQRLVDDNRRRQTDAQMVNARPSLNRAGRRGRSRTGAVSRLRPHRTGGPRGLRELSRQS